MTTNQSTSRSAFWVAVGILSSRISGLVRDRLFAHFFGISAVADAFRAAQRIPNFMQNLLGEGALSASFIPAYSRLLAQHNEQDAGRLAGVIASLLGLVISILVLLGVLTAPILTSAIAPGFSGQTHELAVQMVRICFPGTGILVLSAWCLGILNSHRKFLLPYMAPVVQNVTIIVTMIVFRHQHQESLVIYTTWGFTIGSVLVFGVQLPTVLRLVSHLRLSIDTLFPPVREVIKNFLPAVGSRGVVQVSAYIDSMLASFLPSGAVAALANAQNLYLLPVSLFGMSVSAAELPALSSETLGSAEEVAAKLRQRLDAGLRRIAFFVVPSVVAFLVLGDVIIGALYQSGKFGRSDTIYVWGILAGSTVGLLATTLGRLYSSTYYALGNTRTPLKFATVRVILTTVLGYLCALPLPLWLGIHPRWGVAGLTASAGIAGWVEFVLLRYSINQQIGKTGLPFTLVVRLWGAALTAAGLGWGIKFLLSGWSPLLLAAVVLGPYGMTYFALAWLMRVPEVDLVAGKILKRFRR